jgi:hypothetical protein
VFSLTCTAHRFGRGCLGQNDGRTRVWLAGCTGDGSRRGVCIRCFGRREGGLRLRLNPPYALILQIVGYIATATIPNGTQSFFLVLLMGFATVSLGQLVITSVGSPQPERLGYSVLESAKAQEITLKDKTLSDMKVIIVMARHTILSRDKSIFIVPTADIAQFKSPTP